MDQALPDLVSTRMTVHTYPSGHPTNPIIIPIIS